MAITLALSMGSGIFVSKLGGKYVFKTADGLSVEWEPPKGTKPEAIQALDDAAGGKGLGEALENVKIFETNPFDETGKLKPNIRYKTGEYDYYYETDELGRISKVDADGLQLTNRDGRIPHNPDTPGKLEGDHAGHLVGDRFGGSPELDNLVSQLASVNLSEYKKLENIWAKALEEGKNVSVNIEVKYGGDSLRPSEFIVEYTIDGDFFQRKIFN